MKLTLVNSGTPSKKFTQLNLNQFLRLNHPMCLFSKFSHFFNTGIRSLKESAYPLISFTWRFTETKPDCSNKTFDMGYVSKIYIERELRSLKRHKATGIDNLPPNMLKDCAKHIATPLCYIINLSITTSTVPMIWKSAKVTPVFKSGVPTEPSI